MFAENLRIGIYALFGAGTQVFAVGGHIYGGCQLVQLLRGFAGAAADDDELRFERAQGFVVRLKQRADVFRLAKRVLQIRQHGFVHGCAHGHAQCGERVQRAQIIHGNVLWIFRHHRFAARGFHGYFFALNIVRFQRGFVVFIRCAALRLRCGRSGIGLAGGLAALLLRWVARGERGEGKQGDKRMFHGVSLLLKRWRGLRQPETAYFVYNGLIKMGYKFTKTKMDSVKTSVSGCLKPKF